MTTETTQADTNTAADTTAVGRRIRERFKSLYEADWNVSWHGEGFALVDDGATRWWCRASDITDELLDQSGYPITSHLETQLRKLGEETPYDRLCSSLEPLRDEEVPGKIVDQAREYWDVDDGDSVARGW